MRQFSPGTYASTLFKRHASLIAVQAVMALALVLCANSLKAEPLDPAICASLENERKTLEESGIKDDIQKGPDWVRANLSKDRIEWVLRYIHVEDQISFRCAHEEPIDESLLPAAKPREAFTPVGAPKKPIGSQ